MGETRRVGEDRFREAELSDVGFGTFFGERESWAVRSREQAESISASCASSSASTITPVATNQFDLYSPAAQTGAYPAVGELGMESVKGQTEKQGPEKLRMIV